MNKPRHEDEILVESTQKLKRPDMYRVILLNDDYTTMEFVVQVLETVFHKSESAAHQLMMQIHLNGKGICGVYTYEVAEMKVATVTELARQREYPLKCVMEED